MSDLDVKPQARRPLRVAVVGVSTSQVCGVHDHATVLADALARENVSCTMHWLTRTRPTLRGTRAEIRAWLAQLVAQLEADRPEALILHYSVFSYSFRGVPVFVAPTLSALKGVGVPLISVLHEFAYPWGRSGWRGTAWAVTQRALLVKMMLASTAALVTMDARADWLASRAWLPRRPLVVAPVFSNLPSPAIGSKDQKDRRTIGLFGYAQEAAAVSLVLDALRLLEDRERGVQLRLLGAPGRTSTVAEHWLEEARRRGVEHALLFSGTLAAQDLSDALAACQILLSADSPGPTSRKTTLAASLASGSPVVAIDGGQTWPALAEADALRIVAPASQALAATLATLLDDASLRSALGARGREFAERRMGVAVSATVLADLLERLLVRRDVPSLTG